jgi:hypothetical protein
MKVPLGRSATAKTLLPFLLYALGASSFAAVRTDPRLLSLVPAGSQFVEGMHQVGPDRQTASLLLLTDGNCLDFADFFAITGSDAARLVRLVIFTASARHDGEPPEHSLIASGRFDQERIFRSAKEGSNKTEYRGVPALVVSPFDRERARLSEERWFVILGLHLALFGTVASVTGDRPVFGRNSTRLHHSSEAGPPARPRRFLVPHCRSRPGCTRESSLRSARSCAWRHDQEK